MFSTDQEQKLDWMYKTPNSMVEREEYLLGRSVDKTLEQLNEEEKRKQSAFALPQPKNHVEHECIPPSIREYNMQVDEQVDLQAKLKEDPLVAIKKREEETRRQFLQNPVQLKKLQKALKAQEMKKTKKKKRHKSHKSDKELDEKIKQKLSLLKSGNILGKERKKKSTSLETVLMHKFNSLKDKLSQEDLQNILQGKISSESGSDSEEEEEVVARKPKKRESSKEKQHKPKKKHSKPCRKQSRSRSRERMNHKNKSPEKRKARRDSSSDSDSSVREQNWGLVKSDGRKIELKGKHSKEIEGKQKAKQNPSSDVKEVPKKRQKLSEEEKEQRRQEMMQNAEWREVERAKNVKYYREKDSKESSKQDFNPDFMRKELLKSANSSTVESRIKANINKIQRSGSDMNTHFSRRR